MINTSNVISEKSFPDLNGNNPVAVAKDSKITSKDEIFEKSQTESSLFENIKLLKSMATQQTSSLSLSDIQPEDFKKALTDELLDIVKGLVTGWETPYVEKPSFNYIVDREANKYSKIASREVQENKLTVLSSVTNTEIAKMALINMQAKLHPDVPPPNYELTNPEFQKFYKALREAASRTYNYETSGRLVTVGWGNGDHVTVTSDHIPAGHVTISNKLANHITSILYAPK